MTSLKEYLNYNMNYEYEILLPVNRNNLHVKAKNQCVVFCTIANYTMIYIQIAKLSDICGSVIRVIG